MKYPILFACILCVYAMADEIPPLQGNVLKLRLAPLDAPHGPTTNGLTLTLWSEKSIYELNSRMNVWVILSNTNKDVSGRTIPYDTAIHKDDYLTITDKDGKQTKIKIGAPTDGPEGVGFEGGISEMLHRDIRHPGVYKIQWKIGALESNVIEIKVEPPRLGNQETAQQTNPPYPSPAMESKR